MEKAIFQNIADSFPNSDNESCIAISSKSDFVQFVLCHHTSHYLKAMHAWISYEVKTLLNAEGLNEQVLMMFMSWTLIKTAQVCSILLINI